MLEPILVRQGVRELRVSKPGYDPWVKKVTIKPQEPLTVDVVLIEAGREEFKVAVDDSPSYTPWIVMGTGAALIGGGVFAGISAQGLYADLEARRDDQLLIASKDIDVGNQWVLITNTLLGLGITSLTTGGVLWMLEPPKSERSPKSPRPLSLSRMNLPKESATSPFASDVTDPLQGLSSSSLTELSKGKQ